MKNKLSMSTTCFFPCSRNIWTRISRPMIVKVQCPFLRMPCATSQPQTKTTKPSPPNLRLSPKNFGRPNSRDRAWRICFRRAVKRWASKYSLEQLAQMLLMDPDVKLALDYGCYLFEREMDPENGVIPEDQLSRCLAFFKYHEKFFDELIFASPSLMCHFFKYKFPDSRPSHSSEVPGSSPREVPGSLPK